MYSVWRLVEPNKVNSLVLKRHSIKMYGTVEEKLQSCGGKAPVIRNLDTTLKRVT
jgi:hypothetical protein